MATTTQKLTFEEYIAQYGDDPRYELIDGELRDMEPTGPHEAVAGKIAGQIFTAMLRSHVNWFIPKNCLIKAVLIVDQNQDRFLESWRKYYG